MPTAREVLAKMKQRQEEAVSAERLAELIDECAERGSVPRVEKVWSCAQRLAGATFVRGWSQKELGQVGILCRDIGHTEVAVFLAESVTRWPEVSKAISVAGGSKIDPRRPTLGWLLHHRDVILDHLTKGTSVKEAGREWNL